MEFIKRAFCSIKHRKGQNIVLIIAYTQLFALTLGILLVYLSASAQVDLLQKSLGSAVTLRTNVWDMSLPGSVKYCSIRAEDAQAFIDSPYVESYNKVGLVGYAAFEGNLVPYIRDANRSLYELQMSDGLYIGYPGDCLMIPVTQSEKYEAFTALGFSLVEGRHFTAEDTDAVIISKKLAEINGLKVGDQMTFASGYGARRLYESEGDIQHVTLTICGLMDVPDAQKMGYDVSVAMSDPYNVVFSSYEATKVLSNIYRPEIWLQDLTVYLKSADDMDAFIQETQEKLTIERVAGSTSGFGGVAGDKDIFSEEGAANAQERYDRFAGGDCFYTLFLDNEWYDVVAVPMESVRNLLGIFLVIVLIGSAVVLALVALLSLRGRQQEFGILLAMGESKRKVTGQIFVEVFAPLLVAAALGAILGTQVVVPLAEDYSSGLLSVRAREEQTDLRAGIDDRDFWYYVQEGKFIQEEFNHHSYRTLVVADAVPYEAGPEVYGAYFALDFGMVVLILLIQMLSVLRVKPARILTGRE